MNLKRIIREELNKQVLKEADNWIDIDCCPDKAGCICRAEITTPQTVVNCCPDSCEPVPCTTGWPDDDKIAPRGGEKKEPMGTTMAESRGYRRYRTRR